MIDPSVEDVCVDCRRQITPKDWTCPHCGAILDRFLFSTVTSKSVSGADKDAFSAGVQACMTKWKEDRKTELGDYRPVSGHETAYRAGWRDAAAKITGKKERARGRRRGLELIGIGGPLLAAGTVVFVSTHPHILVWYLLAAGAIALVLGIVMLISGVSDV